jgi:hypothetical protein
MMKNWERWSKVPALAGLKALVMDGVSLIALIPVSLSKLLTARSSTPKPSTEPTSSEPASPQPTTSPRLGRGLKKVVKPSTKDAVNPTAKR